VPGGGPLCPRVHDPHTHRMTVEPAPPVLGRDEADEPPPHDRACHDRTPHDRSADDGDDAGVRRTARRQWRARRDLERQLHDGAALRISALTLRLGLLRHRLTAGAGDLHLAVEEVQDELHLVLQELRDLAGSLYPPLLDEAGLGPALMEVAARSAVQVHVDAPDERFDPAVEGAAYFALLGCLTAGARQGGEPGSTSDDAPPVEVVVRRAGDALVLLVSGVDACHAASIHDGVRLVGGSVAVGDPTQIGPPLITVRIPCE